ncbi:MAG TPA: glycosyl hydrolase, partial [Chitinophagaceae bacterium]|nr:glycosyl hydrolase [Chitinophagaceae bacterium]
MEASFKNPPIENRPLALWAWLNGYVDTAQLVYELKEMKDKGMRGAFIWDVGAIADPEKLVPAGPAFLGPESLEYISLTLKTAGSLGLEMGLFASSSWNAGGPWVSEDDASKELVSVVQSVTGSGVQKIEIGTPKLRSNDVKEYALISSMAVPHSKSKEIETKNKVINLDKFTLGGKYIEWEVP